MPREPAESAVNVGLFVKREGANGKLKCYRHANQSRAACGGERRLPKARASWRSRFVFDGRRRVVGGDSDRAHVTDSDGKALFD